uniref:Blue copper protein n=2 Tax=Cajanus cajan TaxID=3821 RepID=A0A151SH60_CAJCA|nr:Blue copper protein [Cajanus cajan]
MNKMSGLGGVVAILMLLHYAEAQRVHQVGDSQGWRVPQDTTTYQNWASNQNFTVGDILAFDFQTGRHNVIEVSRDSYSSCNSNNPIGSTWNTGPSNITLNRGGEHYYICGVGQHCANGQRLAINVSGSALPPSTAIPPSSTTTPLSPSSSASTSFPTFIHFLFFSALVIVAF